MSTLHLSANDVLVFEIMTTLKMIEIRVFLEISTLTIDPDDFLVANDDFGDTDNDCNV